MLLIWKQNTGCFFKGNNNTNVQKMKTDYVITLVMVFKCYNLKEMY